MGLLSRKPKVDIEEFCRHFYDSQVFNPIIAGVNVGAGFWESVFSSVVEADQSFAAIDPGLFQKELTALRMELFGLACSHRFKSEESTMKQSFFTRRYLEGNSRLDIWDIMGEYNQVIARSATVTESGEEMGEGRLARARVTMVNKSRANLFYKWAEAHIGNKSSTTDEDEEQAKCVARAANRIGADIRRNNCIAVKLITARLADRLGCDININAEALFRLSAVIFGVYEGSKGAIKAVDLQR